jgi:hypothetical protein
LTPFLHIKSEEGRKSPRKTKPKEKGSAPISLQNPLKSMDADH